MPMGPMLIFDKSVIQSLTLDEAALLDNFYMSNIPPVFFAECLADLEREMVRAKGSAESLVVALAQRTPDSQARGNVFHVQLLESELMGEFDLTSVHFRPVVGHGRAVQTGDSKGMLYRQSDEEEAIQRWEKGDFLGVERQLAKKWRRMIESIDLKKMSEDLLVDLGRWRKPSSLEEAKQLTDAIISFLDQEWLLRYGLAVLGFAEATDWVVKRWVTDRRKNLRSYFPYFTHVLSINIFFALVLPTELLSKVKASHQIDLAYLYYLPFCNIFSSSDNFHVSVAPFFMDPFQTLVPGKELKADLARLDAMFKLLPQEELDKGLNGFAHDPPSDTSFLTTRMWDKYLPSWRTPSPTLTELPEGLIEKLNAMREETSGAAPVHDVHDVDKLEFVTVSKQVSTKKGSYLRYSKETIRKILEENRAKAERAELKVPEVHPPGTLFTQLVNRLKRLDADTKSSNIEICLLSGKRDANGNKSLKDGMWTAEVHRIGADISDEEGVEALRAVFDKLQVLGVLVLWTRYGTGKLGMAQFVAFDRSGPAPHIDHEEDWIQKSVRAYLDSNNL